jgi:hypothetical protein
MKALSYLLPILIFVIQISIINYLFQLERKGCKCAMDYKRTYILAYLVINALFVILHLFTNVFKYTSNNNIASFLMSIYSVGGIVNIAFIIQYVNMLKAKKCECSESIYRDILYISSIIDALTLGLSLLLVFYVVLFSAKDNLKLSDKKRKVR